MFLEAEAETISREAAQVFAENPGNAEFVVQITIRPDWGDLAEEVQPALEATAKEAVASTVATIAPDLTPDEVAAAESDAVRYAVNRAAEMVGKRLVNGELIDNPNAAWAITETTRDRVRALVEQAVRSGWSADRLQQAIQDDVAFSPYRARMIARTEIARANLEGTIAAWRTSGVVAGKRSLLSPLHDQDDECDENAAAGVIALDARFPDGTNGPPFHPNCKCTIEAVLKELS